MKHISIKKSKNRVTILVENYLSDYGTELWRIAYRFNEFAPCYHTMKDGLLTRPSNKTINNILNRF